MSKNTDSEIDKEILLEQIRLDSILASLATKVGIRNADKREAVIIKNPRHLSKYDIDNLFEGCKYAAKLVEQLPDLCTRKTPIYNIEDIGDVKTGDNGSADIITQMQKLINAAMPYFNKALRLARKYGGSVIVLGCNDGSNDLSTPLNLKNLRSLDWLSVREGGIGGQISVYSFQEDPTKLDYNEPLIYQFANGSKIHKSRLLAFNGIDVGEQRSKDKYSGFGMSVLVRAYDDIRDYNISKDSVALALQDFNRILIKMSGLSNLLSQNRRKEIEQRLQIMNYISSVLNVWILDTSDGHEIISRNFTGVKEMIDVLKNDLGANSEIPHTSFFNESPSGITSGASEAMELNQIVLKAQKQSLKEPLERLITLYHQCKEGITEGVNPKSWSVTFPIIHEETTLEKQQIANEQAKERETYSKMGVVTSEEIRKAIALGLDLSSAIDLDK